MPIVLAPSPTPGPLRAAIDEAIQTNQTLELLPGVHLTNPHSSEWIEVPETGLTIRAHDPLGPRPQIKRPDNGMNGDFQYGLAFVPGCPNAAEVSAAQWKRAIDGQRVKNFVQGNDPCKKDPIFNPGSEFEYEIVVRGDVEIQGVDIDCNIQNQPLSQQLPGQPWEHSAMLAFAGASYRRLCDGTAIGTAPDGVERRIYAAFNLVTISAMNTFHHGTADDIWFMRGYFNPNIANVALKFVRSFSRINDKRATISFSELAANIDIIDCDVYSLHVENDDRWDLEPRPSPQFQKAQMNLSAVKADRCGLASKGYVLNLTAGRLNIREEFVADQVTGMVQNSIIYKGTDPRLSRLDMKFESVDWRFVVHDPVPPQHQKPFVTGIEAIPRFGEHCRAVFLRNSFLVEGNLPPDVTGHLISGDALAADPNVSDDQVFLEFDACRFDPRFGSHAFPGTHIANPSTPGVWAFQQADWNGLPLDQALNLPANHSALRRVVVLVF
jgi:hypothetical protein